MNEYWHQTLRHYGTLLIGAAVLIVLGFAVLQHIAPPPKTDNAPVAVFTPSPVEKTAQGALDSYRQYQQLQNSVNRWQTIDQMILSALKSATAQRVTVASNVHTDATPQPLPTASKHLDKSDLTAIYDVSRSATQSVFNDPATHINTKVTIDNVEVPPGRFAATVNSLGQTGISYDAYRRGQYDLGIGGIKSGAHIAPMASLQYILPHTKLGAGFGVVFDHKLEPVVTIGARF